jgi:hypothetical protein
MSQCVLAAATIIFCFLFLGLIFQWQKAKLSEYADQSEVSCVGFVRQQAPALFLTQIRLLNRRKVFSDKWHYIRDDVNDG